MGKCSERRMLGLDNLKGMLLDFGTIERPIVITVPYDFYARFGIIVERIRRADKVLFQRFYELAILLEKAKASCPEYFSDETIRNILTAHIRYKDNAVEKDIIHHIEVNIEFQMVMKAVLRRVGAHVFKNKELITLLSI